MRRFLTLAGVAAAAATYAIAGAPVAVAADACPNAAYRTGASASLPDCRAYELVTPVDTQGHQPTAEIIGALTFRGSFPTAFAAPNGTSLVYGIGGGSLPGFGGNGTTDVYRAIRTSAGWRTTRRLSPTGEQTEIPTPGGIAAGHEYAFWSATSYTYDHGSLVTAWPKGGNYVLGPDGSFSPIGIGSLGTDPLAAGYWITADGSHILFSSEEQLEPAAPASGVTAVYDRPGVGPTRVVSLLPGDVTPTQDATFQGVAADGSGVLFMVGSTLYARLGNAVTRQVADGLGVAVGTTLTCAGGPASATRSYRWLRNGSPISGATDATYTAAAADAGAAVQCQIFALTGNAGSTKVSTPAALVAPIATVQPPAPPASGPVVTPTNPAAGTTLTCATGSWQGAPSFAYQWYADGAPIAGATSSTYIVQPADVPSAIQCAVTGTNAGGAATAVSANRTTSPAPSPAAPSATASTGGSFAVTPAGMSADGDRAFYVQSGNLFAFDTGPRSTTQITTSGDAKFVNVSADGSHVYFTSKALLDGTNGTAGASNLYVWDGQSTHFIATLAAGDSALTKWVPAVVGPNHSSHLGPGSDPSRTTPDGRVLAFVSHAKLTSYDNAGFAEIYRYDTTDGSLVCVSCNPSGAAPTADARLQQDDAPVTDIAVVHNLSDDGTKVFFESEDPLVARDVDGLNDVYEWRAGTGGGEPQLSLLSLGTSARYLNPPILGGQVVQTNFLYGASADGDDVFIRTADALLPAAGSGGTAAIYDVRVGGGFPGPSRPAGCDGDGCQGGISTAPHVAAPATFSFVGPPGVAPARRFTVARISARQRTAFARNGRLRLTAQVPAAGRLSALVVGRMHGHRIVVDRASRSAARAGHVRLTLRLSRSARGWLRKHHRLRLRIELRFSTVPGTRVTRVTLRLRRHAHRSSHRVAPRRHAQRASRIVHQSARAR